MEFTPAETYKELRTQACALATVVNCKEVEIVFLKKTIERLQTELALINPDAVNAERETNKLLTDLLEPCEKTNGTAKA